MEFNGLAAEVQETPEITLHTGRPASVLTEIRQQLHIPLSMFRLARPPQQISPYGI